MKISKRIIQIVLTLALGIAAILAPRLLTANDLGQIVTTFYFAFPGASLICGFISAYTIESLWLTNLLTVIIFSSLIAAVFNIRGLVYVPFYLLLLSLGYGIAITIKNQNNK